MELRDATAAFVLDAESPETAIDRLVGRLRKPARILVACSGGGDSLGLLFLLAGKLGRDHELAAATVDHGLRPGSRAEAEEVGKICAGLGVEHHILSWNGTKPATGIQAAAREARYGLLAGCARSNGYDLVLTGHNFEDQLETLKMRQARSSESFEGIAESVLIMGSVWVHRPLLNVRRVALRDFLRAKSVRWIEDPSNLNQKFERVRVRAEIDPSGSLARANHKRIVPQIGLASFIETNFTFVPGAILSDMAAIPPDNEYFLPAICHAIALAGGRQFLPGAEERKALKLFVEDDARDRFTLGRTVLEKRKGLLYIVREFRNLPGPMKINPGQTIIWDSRFRIGSPGNGRTLSVLPFGAVPTAFPLIDAREASRLPGRIGNLAVGTLPACVDFEGGEFRITPMIAYFDRFLPLSRLPVAQVLANALGMAHFPLPPFG